MNRYRQNAGSPSGEDTVRRVRIALGSVTYAEKARSLLARNGYSARIVRLDPAVTRGGCTYAAELTGNVPDTALLRRLLTDGNVRFTEILEDRVSSVFL